MKYLGGSLVDIHNDTSRSPGDVNNIYDLYGREPCPALKMHTVRATASVPGWPKLKFTVPRIDPPLIKS